MKNIIFKPIFNIGAKGEKGNRGTSYEIPTDSVIAFDSDNDIPEGYIETTDPTGGGGVIVPPLTFLCFGSAQNGGSSQYNQVKAIYTFQDVGEEYNDFLSFDARAGFDNEFTVLQDFTALILPYTYNWDTAASTYSEGEFYINDTLVKSWNVDYTGSKYYRGKPIIVDLKANDTMYGYYPSTNGFPRQCIKIYKINDATSKTALNNIFTFYDDLVDFEGRSN